MKHTKRYMQVQKNVKLLHSRIQNTHIQLSNWYVWLNSLPHNKVRVLQVDNDLSPHNEEKFGLSKSREGHGQCCPVMKRSPSLCPTAVQDNSYQFFLSPLIIFHFEVI